MYTVHMHGGKIWKTIYTCNITDTMYKTCHLTFLLANSSHFEGNFGLGIWNIKMRYFDSYTLNKSKRSGIQSNGVDCKHHHVHVTDKFSFTPPPPLLFLQDSVDKHGNVNFESV